MRSALKSIDWKNHYQDNLSALNILSSLHLQCLSWINAHFDLYGVTLRRKHSFVFIKRLTNQIYCYYYYNCYHYYYYPHSAIVPNGCICSLRSKLLADIYTSICQTAKFVINGFSYYVAILQLKLIWVAFFVLSVNRNTPPTWSKDYLIKWCLLSQINEKNRH